MLSGMPDDSCVTLPRGARLQRGTAAHAVALPALPPDYCTCPTLAGITLNVLLALSAPPDTARLGDPLRMRLLTPAPPRRTVITGARRPPLSSDCAGPERAGAGLRAPVSMLAVAPAQSNAMLCMRASVSVMLPRLSQYQHKLLRKVQMRLSHALLF